MRKGTMLRLIVLLGGAVMLFLTALSMGAYVWRSAIRFKNLEEEKNAKRIERLADADRLLADRSKIVVTTELERDRWRDRAATLESEYSDLKAEHDRLRSRLKDAEHVLTARIGAAPGQNGQSATRSDSVVVDEQLAEKECRKVPDFGCQTIITGWRMHESGVLAWTGIQNHWWRWPGEAIQTSSRPLGPGEFSVETAWPPRCPASATSRLESVAGGHSWSAFAGGGLGDGRVAGLAASWRVFGSRWGIGPTAMLACVGGSCDLVFGGSLTRHW